MKWWDPHTRKIKYFSYAKFDKNNNKFGKGWYPGSNMLKVTDISDLPTVKIDLYYHPLIKDDIFEATVAFPKRGTPICIITYYCEHYKTTYIYQSNNNIPWNIAFPSRQRTNNWIISIGIKEPTTVQQVIEAVPSNQQTVI